jgi:hypothetical protein
MYTSVDKCFLSLQEEADFERSVHQLDALLQGCEVSPAGTLQTLHGLHALLAVKCLPAASSRPRSLLLQTVVQTSSEV